MVQLRKYKLCTVLPIWRTPHSVNGFCGQLFGSVASYLHLRLIFCKYKMFTMVMCHIFHMIISIIPEIVWAKSAVLTIPKYQQRTVLFTNKRKYKSREHGTNNFGNGARKHLRIFVYIFLVWFKKTAEYDEVNTRSNEVAIPIYIHISFDVNALHVMDMNLFDDDSFFMTASMMVYSRRIQW